MMLVWMFNENVVAKGKPSGWFWSLTQGNRGALYFVACLLAAFVVYFTISQAPLWSTGGLMFALIAGQTLNFYHFINDVVIWRAKRKAVGAPI